MTEETPKPKAPKKTKEKPVTKPEAPKDEKPEEPSDLPFDEQQATDQEDAKPEPPKAEKPKTPNAENPAEGKPKFTAEFIRAEFKKVRDRLEFGECAPGEAKGPNAKADAKIHNLLTQRFMEFSMNLGNVKPTELVNLPNAAELVPRFIEQINELYVANGEVLVKPPF